jgi:DNA-binding response OmpR family regulator
MPNVLLVDDDKILSNLLEYKLKQIGYTVEIKDDGAAAVEALKARQYDVLLLDIMMPRLDGFQLMRSFEKEELKRPGATIVVSARSEESDILLAFKLGAVDYVTKPFSINVLMARIEIALRCKGDSASSEKPKDAAS